MGHEPLTKYVVLAVVFLQFTIAFLLRHTHPLSWKFLVAAYTIGGTANHNLFLAIHEITHNLAFKGVKPNKLLAIFANLPIGVPYAISFKVNRHFSLQISRLTSSNQQGYHLEHHKYLGEDGIDTDLPTRLELICLNNVLGKVFFWWVPVWSLTPTADPTLPTAHFRSYFTPFGRGSYVRKSPPTGTSSA
jgi:sphingolipid delta-4 desaturase